MSGSPDYPSVIGSPGLACGCEPVNLQWDTGESFSFQLACKMGFTQYIEKMDIVKLLDCDISVEKPYKTFSSSQMNQIKVYEMCVCSHNHISIMTKSFPIHLTCLQITA